MIGPRAETRVWLAAGVTDMRCGIDSLAAKVQTALTDDPFSGHVFAFRGRRGDLVKLLWSDGDGMCLLTKRLEKGRFIWPQAENGRVSLSAARLNRSRQVIFLVAGESKHEAVAEWRNGKNIPARAIAPTAGVDVLVESALLMPLPVRNL